MFNRGKSSQSLPTIVIPPPKTAEVFAAELEVFEGRKSQRYACSVDRRCPKCERWMRIARYQPEARPDPKANSERYYLYFCPQPAGLLWVCKRCGYELLSKTRDEE
jgi:hypothetical protein